ncbi:MAG TPA: hypothetical protein VF701_11910 [Thermoanaerobaculia bacterium]
MTKRLLAALLAVSLTVPLYADFASIARAIDAQHGVKRVWIPFLGLARAAVRVTQPQGVRDFQLVTFKGTGGLDGQHLSSLVRSKIAPGFQPLVQVWSRKSGDRSFIYARPHPNGNRVELIIVAQDGEETVLVRVDVDADVIARQLGDEPRNVTFTARR